MAADILTFGLLLRELRARVANSTLYGREGTRLRWLADWPLGGELNRFVAEAKKKKKVQILRKSSPIYPPRPTTTTYPLMAFHLSSLARAYATCQFD